MQPFQSWEKPTSGSQCKNTTALKNDPTLEKLMADFSKVGRNVPPVRSIEHHCFEKRPHFGKVDG
jgi:hypothetical protein